MLYVYIGCLAFGTMYAFVSSIFGSHGFDHGGMDGHDASHSADAPSPFSPLVIASAIATFGAIGIIGKTGLRMGDILSAVLALASAGIIGAAIFFGVVKLMYGSQSNSTFSISDLIGAEAEVITPIPENGFGEIALVVNGIRYNFPARSSRSDLGRGAVVTIRDISGSTAIVAQKVSIEDIDSFEADILQLDKRKENEL